MIRVAIIGPDGSGKSSVVAGVKARLGSRAETIYMGLNPKSGGSALPTTRLRARLRRRADVARARLAAPSPPGGRGISRLPVIRELRSAARLTNRLGEEAWRHAGARRIQRAGRIALLDRDYLLDYDATDVRPDRVSLERRIHGAVLVRFPRPDLVVLLDAPGEALFARKGEWSVEYLERRREEYRFALRHVARSEIIDATLPLETIVDRVVELIESTLAERTRQTESR